MTAGASSLRDRAIQAHLDEQQLRDSALMDRRDIQLARLEHTLVREIRRILHHEVALTDLHQISDGGVPVPAWKSPDGLLFSLARHGYCDGYGLHLVTWCDDCHRRCWYRVPSMAKLGEFLSLDLPCWWCEDNISHALAPVEVRA